MKKILRNILTFLPLVVVMWVAAPKQVHAQCPMCKAAVESNSNNGKGAHGKGSFLARNLNMGILYLFVLPYCAIMGVGILWYRGYRRKKREEALEQMVTLDSVSGLEGSPGNSPPQN